MNNTRQLSTISHDAGQRVVAGARAKAEEIGKPSTIAVVDTSGDLVAYLRMDGASLFSSQVAIDKAYTAAQTRMPTQKWASIVTEPIPAIVMASGIRRLNMIGGGIPILIDHAVIGAIGVSGGTDDEDISVADAGAATLG